MRSRTCRRPISRGCAGDARFTITAKASDRLIYLYVDSGRDQSPLVTAKDGAPIAKNPLRDVRVRRALSMAINRDAIRDRLMDGLSYPTDNLIPAPMPGNDPAREAGRRTIRTGRASCWPRPAIRRASG